MTLPSDGSVTLENLSKRYGGAPAVDGVSVAVPSGGFVSLLGPSGSGKTTTLMMAAGFVQPDAGTVRIGGVDVTQAPPQRRGLGMVFQNYALFPHLDVAGNIAFPLRIRRTPEAEVARRVAEALDMVRMGGLGGRRIGQLSGGQQQRVALARATVFRPAVVLMDEPLGALDKNLRFQMQTEIKDIQRRLGMTVIYVTHDQEEAMNMSDTIAIMDRGRIVQSGPPQDVYDRPATPFAGRFLGEASLIPGECQPDGFRVRHGPLLPLSSAGSPDVAATWLLLRPERVVLHPPGAPPAGLAALPGTVSRTSFLGGTVRRAIEVGLDQPLLSDTPHGPQPGPEPGAAVLACWRPEDAVLLRPDPA